MTVYVDQKTTSKHNHAGFCLMVADDDVELHQMAIRIEVDRACFADGQYSIPYRKRRPAIDNGAVIVGRRELGAMAMLKRCGQPMGDPDTAVARMHDFFKLAPALLPTTIKEDA